MHSHTGSRPAPPQHPLRAGGPLPPSARGAPVAVQYYPFTYDAIPDPFSGRVDGLWKLTATDPLIIHTSGSSLCDEAGVQRITMSDDGLHYGSAAGGHARACRRRPSRSAHGSRRDRRRATDHQPQWQGKANVCGGVMFRGRAADKLTSGLPRWPWETLSRCAMRNSTRPLVCMWTASGMSISARESAWATCGRRR